jgi:UDP-glucose 4-epimerase
MASVGRPRDPQRTSARRGQPARAGHLAADPADGTIGGATVNVGVIGGSGFVGRHVVELLTQAGHEVTVFDIMRPPRDDVRHIYVDITDSVQTTVALAGVYDVVYMLAAMADVDDVYRNPVEASTVNVLGVANVLEACRRHGIPRLILASTIWVYDVAAVDDVDETTPVHPDRVPHVYTATKLAAEMYCAAYARLFGVGYTILRYGIPYGPGARDRTVLATFVRRALQGLPLVVHGEGQQFRHFVYVEDLAAGNVAALQEAAVNRTFNLAGDRAVTVREIAETVCRLVADVEIQYQAPRPGDSPGKRVSSRHAYELLGWKPRVTFEEGVRHYLRWLQGGGQERDGPGR